jgi:hypothetical protein
MKCYSLLVGIIVAAVTCSSLLAQEKAALQPNATVLSILQGSTGKTVELRLNSGENRAANSNKLMTISSFFLI